LFSRARLRDPMKAKQLQKGLRQLGEEGAVQVFEPLIDTSNPLIGAVGQLQFEVVEHRLKSEYGVDAVFERAGIQTARWVTCPDANHLAEFVKANQSRLAKDVDGNYAYLADSGVNLRLAQERWPKVQFYATREHGQQLS
jgi:peptide chain release factor 3